MDEVRPGADEGTKVVALRDGHVSERVDRLATEEPLEIRLITGARMTRVAVTMRTPGADFDLAAGFLFAEGVVGPGDIEAMSYCVDRELNEEQRLNVVNVRLRAGLEPQLGSLDRQFVTTSACGVCGKESIDALRVRGLVPPHATG